MRIGIVFATLLSAAAIIFAAAAPTPPVNRYIDTKVCAGCHRQVYESYQRTSMGKSFFAPTAANTIEDYQQNHTFDHAVSDTHYAMLARDGAYYQRRWQTGFDGRETNLEEMKIDYVVGAGDHARSYLHRTAAGALVELPLGWYSERGGYWAMSPGFDSHHPQTRRLVSYECMFCHNAYPQSPTAAQVRSPEPVFSGVLPQGVDCQRCHGPGEQHVRTAQTQGVSVETIRASIVNPARLNPQRQMEVCLECHLEPTSGRLPSLIRRFDRAPYSYRPGQPLEDFLLYFDYPAGIGHDDKFEIAGAAYRLRKSRCFIESKAALTCLTCHDPHQSLPTGAAGAQYFSQKCLGCHQQTLAVRIAAGSHPREPDCLGCHMPQRRTEDVVHAVVTDHFIQRRLPARDLLAELAERHLSDAEEYHGVVVPYYPNPLPATGDNPLYRAVAQVAFENNLEQGVLELSRELAARSPREEQFYTTLGDAYRNSGDAVKAASAFQQAVVRNPESITALVSLAVALRAAGQPVQGEQALQRALRLAPGDAQVWMQYGLLEAGRGHPASAIEKLQQAVLLHPDLPDAYTVLAGLYLGGGQLSPAEDTARAALRIDPYDAAAYDVAGRALAGGGQAAEALFDFAKAARLRPGHGPYQYDYALMLVRLQRLEEAQAPAQAAVDSDPDFAPGHDLLGTLFAQKHQLEQAAQEYQKSVELEPGFSRAQLDLGLVLAAEGDLAGATAHLRVAAKGRDAAVAGRAAQALERLPR